MKEDVSYISFFIPQNPIFIKLVISTSPGGELNSTQTDGLALLGCF